MDETEPPNTAVYLFDLLQAIVRGATKLMAIVDPLVNEAAYPRHRLQSMKRLRNDLEERWRSAAVSFNAAIAAHAQGSFQGLSKADTNDLATVVKHLDLLSRFNPRNPDDSDLALLDHVEVLAAALPLRLHDLFPGAQSTAKKPPVRRRVPKDLTAKIEAALADDLWVSQATLAERFRVSLGTINNNPAWKAGIRRRDQVLEADARPKLTEEQRIREELRRSRADLDDGHDQE